MNTQPELRLGYHLVIIVEDDRAVRDSLKFSLVVEGFAVRAYPDAEHLLAEEHLPDFDCLIVDQNMPGMNGLDLISLLRARQIEAPAILITSHPNSSLRNRATAARIPIIENRC
jgi:two-component system, LuxR family, response regulator FixJ